MKKPTSALTSTADAAKPAVQAASPDLESPAEVAAYISEMTGVLARLARRTKLGALAYLLEMTQAEAALQVEKAK